VTPRSSFFLTDDRVDRGTSSKGVSDVAVDGPEGDSPQRAVIKL
jgi:hypothetical protein